MLHTKRIRILPIIIFIMIVLAGSSLAESTFSSAKTRQVRIKGGTTYKLPKKASHIVIKNKKILRLLKNNKLMALKKGKSKVTYVYKGRKVSINVAVYRYCNNKRQASSETQTEPGETPIQTPINAPINTPAQTPAQTFAPTPPAPTSTPWGTIVPSNIYNLVITKMEPGEKEGETVLYCDDLGYEYEYNEKDNFKYKMKTEKLICTTTTHNAEKFKVGDYVYLGLNLYIHNSIDIRYGVTVVTGLVIVYPYTPEKKDEYANIPDIKVLKDTSLWFKLDNQKITRDTTILKGTRVKCPWLKIEVFVNDEKRTEYKCVNSYFIDYFEFKVDFSDCKAGDVVKMVMTFCGDKEKNIVDGVKLYNDPFTNVYIVSE